MTYRPERRPSKAFNRWAARDGLQRCMANYRAGRAGPGNLRMAIDLATRNAVSSVLVEEATGLLHEKPGGQDG